ncbi:dipeptide epimerase [Sphingomonas sp. BT-65]|uniref:N-acetyl-D-Glu racemase DgcA n=1 Tax=Sphingomonas sp. BT-65 TaxID=2989821 RepID=UPI0022366CA5|nr:N-acetyl-D-Glu racemase DgcA [Sphingomonas sp. BT-65]MCW4463414.1 dipeptide epimerase [Sphingomonas sp. BT-65]
MLRAVSTGIERRALHTPFRIARGSRTQIELAVVTIRQGDAIGRGEGSVTGRYGESAEGVADQLRAIEGAIADGAGRDALRALMPPGSARNAVDCALWDLEAKLGLVQPPAVQPVHTALTLGIDTPEAMAAAAHKLKGVAIVKVKVDGNEPAACLRAIRPEVPGSRLVVDANEAWTMAQVEALQPLLAELEVEFLEQPLPAAEDAALEGFKGLVPICADESCHVTADLDRLVARYQMVNIKLDKTGGLTEALDLHAGARARGLGVMVGCMISTSLAIAAAFRVAVQADCADLDGPLWLAEDRSGGIRMGEHGLMHPPEPGFWGS